MRTERGSRELPSVQSSGSGPFFPALDELGYLHRFSPCFKEGSRMGHWPRSVHQAHGVSVAPLYR